MRKALKMFFLILLFFFLLLFLYFFIGSPKKADKITWGVNFSQAHTQNLGLDWKKTYSAILEDLRAKNLKISVDWNLIEPENEKYNFDDLDWQINQAEKAKVRLILVVGMKTLRWPECHEPDWVKNQGPEMEGEKLLEYIRKVVNRYKNSSAIWAWQVENEPFFHFGECPKFNENLFKKEVNLVKKLDPGRPIIISESGEFTSWFHAAKYADIIGTTIYRKVWFKEINSYLIYPFPPIFYDRKAELIKSIFGKKVICVELQAEPWGPRLLYDISLKEQKKTMDLKQFKKNIEFAKKTGINKFYLWGVEWWYWLKTEQNEPAIWNEAKKILN